MRNLLLALISFPFLMGGCSYYPLNYFANKTDYPIAMTTILEASGTAEEIFRDQDRWVEDGMGFTDSLHPPEIYIYIGHYKTKHTSPLALPSFCAAYSLENPPTTIAFDSTLQAYRCTCLDTLEDDRIKATFFILPGEVFGLSQNLHDIGEVHLSWADPETGQVNRMDLLGAEAIATLLQPLDENQSWKLEMR